MLPNIHILGIQGSGKGTQSALLVTRYRLTYAAAGNLFRERAAQDDVLGQSIAQELKAGHLLSDDLLAQTVASFLEANPPANGLVGDGVIRTLSQEEKLAPLWKQHNLEEPFLIVLELSEEQAAERIKQREATKHDETLQAHHHVYSGKLVHRTDDNPVALEERFRLFHQMTEPVIRRFAESGRCLKLDGDRSVEAIHQDICSFLERTYPNLSHGIA